MKNLIKLLLIASFGVVVFLPAGTISDALYWSLFVLMFILLVLYYRFAYWVGIQQVEDIIDEPILFSMFCGKVPPITAEDLVRGRLVVTPTKVVLYQKASNSLTKARCKAVWSVNIDQIASFGLGKVVAARKGLILYLQDGGDARFTYSRMSKRKDELTKALGWVVEPQEESSPTN
jgi:hypothetical protein